MILAEQIKAEAARLGFSLCGMTSALPPPHHRHYAQWLAEGKAGEMLYLHRQEPKRGDLSLILPGVKSVVCVALNYSPETGMAPNPSPVPGEGSMIGQGSAALNSYPSPTEWGQGSARNETGVGAYYDLRNPNCFNKAARNRRRHLRHGRRPHRHLAKHPGRQLPRSSLLSANCSRLARA